VLNTFDNETANHFRIANTVVKNDFCIALYSRSNYYHEL